MVDRSPKGFQMTIGELAQRRERFQLAPNAIAPSEELSLREKQAVIDEILRGVPIREIEYHKDIGPDGKIIYLVTKGWPQIHAIFDFLDDKFPTWTDAEREEWIQDHKPQ